MSIGFPYNTIMNFPRFYCPAGTSNALAVGACVDLPENAARHAARVLRLRAGDGLVLFNGTGGEYTASIVAVERDRVSVEVQAWHDIECEAPIQLTLVQALQSGEKMDITVQKAVELGVARIVPVRSRRSVVKLDGERAVKRLEHWRGVVESACEQCGRNRVPEVEALENLDRWLARPVAPEVLRLILVPGAERTLGLLVPPARGGQVELLIGAEGGLAPDEIEMAEKAGYVGIRLGPRILRTETAGLAALAAMQCLWGDFGENANHV